MVERFKETGQPVFKSLSALSRGIMTRKKNRHTTHFNADAPNTELNFDRFTQQVSSVSTEQSQAGVKSSV